MAYTDKSPEAKTTHKITNPILEASGWVIQRFKVANVIEAKVLQEI